MCFAVTADLVVGTALQSVAVLALHEVGCPRELPFAVHQLIEAVVWARLAGNVSADGGEAAVLAYVLIALPVLPTLLPLSVLLLEPRGARLRVAPFVALGLVVSAYLGAAVLSRPVRVIEHPHGLEYVTAVDNGDGWAVLSIVAVIGPALLSGYRSIVAFGGLNLVGIVTVLVLFAEAFDSLWCVYAAASVLVLLHMARRRRLPDPHRLHGIPLRPLVGS